MARASSTQGADLDVLGSGRRSRIGRERIGNAAVFRGSALGSIRSSAPGAAALQGHVLVLTVLLQRVICASNAPAGRLSVALKFSFAKGRGLLRMATSLKPLGDRVIVKPKAKEE